MHSPRPAAGAQAPQNARRNLLRLLNKSSQLPPLYEATVPGWHAGGPADIRVCCMLPHELLHGLQQASGDCNFAFLGDEQLGMRARRSAWAEALGIPPADADTCCCIGSGSDSLLAPFPFLASSQSGQPFALSLRPCCDPHAPPLASFLFDLFPAFLRSGDTPAVRRSKCPLDRKSVV